MPQRALGDRECSRDLRDRAAGRLHKSDRLTTELGRVLRWTTHTGLLPLGSSPRIGCPRNQVNSTAIKFAKLIGIPWLLFCDTDQAGQAAAQQLMDAHSEGDASHLVPITGTDTNDEVPGAIERMLIAFDDDLCRQACFDTRPDLGTESPTLDLMKRVKGSVGTALARRLISKYPSPADWPEPVTVLIERLGAFLDAEPGGAQ